MFKLSLFVAATSAADWNDSPGGVKDQIDATRAGALAKEWLDSCATRPQQFQAACRGQCETALSVAGCESEWDSFARNPTGCNGNMCMGVLQLGCQWLTPEYACKDVAASVFTSKGFNSCSGSSEPFAGPELDSAVIQLSQCLLENVLPSQPYSLDAWKNQWACANMPTDEHYVAAQKLAATACNQARQANVAQYV